MNDDPALVEQFYAKFWAQADWAGPNPNQDEQLRLEAILRLIRSLPAPGPMNILDIGCGRGWLSSQLSAFGKVLGLDPTRAAIEAARRLFPSLEFEVGAVDGLIARGLGAQFDLVVCSEVIEHVKYQEQAAFLAGVHQLTKPGSWVILTTPRGELWERWQAKGVALQPVEAWLTEAALHRLASTTGFKVMRTERIGFDYVASLPLRIARKFRRIPGLTRLLQPFLRAYAIYQVLLLQRG